MAKLTTDPSMRDLLRAVASADGGHGAVSVAAVSGAFGTSLILMAAMLPQTRSGSAQDRARLVEASVTLTEIPEQLLELRGNRNSKNFTPSRLSCFNSKTERKFSRSIYFYCFICHL